MQKMESQMKLGAMRRREGVCVHEYVQLKKKDTGAKGQCKY